ncbi:anti-phage protein KwaA [Algoriphagus resistens]|uniref:anti-phage protein KwaA n=1 Tax=Algoriphagus resistens TaxID=1750590 RepID=UPI00071685D6|nr:anti-phage protein KwaA [Algoriphagus resistens]
MKLKIQLYILSLWLLFALLFVNKIQIPICFDNCQFIGLNELLLQNVIPIICIIFIVAGFWFYYRFKYIIKGAKSLPEKIEEIENINWEHLTFLVTYVIPLLSFDLDFNLSEDRNGLMFFLVLIVIGMIYVKTNMFYNNPTLAILGYHIYKTKTFNKGNIVIISRDVIQEQDWVEHKLISDNIYFAIKSKKNGIKRA